MCRKQASALCRRIAEHPKMANWCTRSMVIFRGIACQRWLACNLRERAWLFLAQRHSAFCICENAYNMDERDRDIERQRIHGVFCSQPESSVNVRRYIRPLPHTYIHTCMNVPNAHSVLTLHSRLLSSVYVRTIQDDISCVRFRLCKSTFIIIIIAQADEIDNMSI